MRIIDRETFLSLPAGTVYAKWGDAKPLKKDCHILSYEAVSVKGETCMSGNDFVDEPLLAGPEDCHSSEEWADAMIAAIAGKETAPMRIGDDGCRDGMYDEHQLFAVYSKLEVERLLSLLTWAHENGYK